jgi:hypothetical protein
VMIPGQRRHGPRARQMQPRKSKGW